MSELKPLSVGEIISKIDANDKDFSNSRIFGVDWAGKDLSGVNFSNSKLEWVRFNGCKLNNTMFKSAKIEWSNFSDTDCTEANFSSTKIEHSLFENTIFKNTKFIKSEIRSCMFLNATLGGADFSNSTKIRFMTSAAEITEDDIQFVMATLIKSGLSKEHFLRSKNVVDRAKSLSEGLKLFYGDRSRFSELPQNTTYRPDSIDARHSNSYSSKSGYDNKDAYLEARSKAKSKKDVYK